MSRRNWKAVFAAYRKAHPLSATGDARLSTEEWELCMAIEEYKRTNGRPFPAFTEVLAIMLALGYRRVKGAALPEAEAVERFRTRSRRARARQRHAEVSEPPGPASPGSAKSEC